LVFLHYTHDVVVFALQALDIINHGLNNPLIHINIIDHGILSWEQQKPGPPPKKKTLTHNVDGANTAAWSPLLGRFAMLGYRGLQAWSSDGLSWTQTTSDIGFAAVIWCPELRMFVTAMQLKIMTSVDGINWITRYWSATSSWRSVVWSPEFGILVAVAGGSTDYAATSTDGILWTLRTAAALNTWQSVTWSKTVGLFVAVSNSGTGNRVMTSPNGIDWTSRRVQDFPWIRVVWSEEKGFRCNLKFSGSIDD
jgi:hypothetical protein